MSPAAVLAKRRRDRPPPSHALRSPPHRRPGRHPATKGLPSMMLALVLLRRLPALIPGGLTLLPEHCETRQCSRPSLPLRPHIKSLSNTGSRNRCPRLRHPRRQAASSSGPPPPRSHPSPKPCPHLPPSPASLGSLRPPHLARRCTPLARGHPPHETAHLEPILHSHDVPAISTPWSSTAAFGGSTNLLRHVPPSPTPPNSNGPPSKDWQNINPQGPRPSRRSPHLPRQHETTPLRWQFFSPVGAPRCSSAHLLPPGPPPHTTGQNLSPGDPATPRSTGGRDNRPPPHPPTKKRKIFLDHGVRQ